MNKSDEYQEESPTSISEQPSHQAEGDEQKDEAPYCEVRFEENGNIVIECSDPSMAQKLVDALEEESEVVVRVKRVRLEDDTDTSSSVPAG